MIPFKSLSIFLFLVFIGCTRVDKHIDTHLLIVGGGASGITAGIQAARLGIPTLIIEKTPWLGDMLTTAGVSATDGNYPAQFSHRKV